MRFCESSITYLIVLTLRFHAIAFIRFSIIKYKMLDLLCQIYHWITYEAYCEQCSVKTIYIVLLTVYTCMKMNLLACILHAAVFQYACDCLCMRLKSSLCIPDSKTSAKHSTNQKQTQLDVWIKCIFGSSFHFLKSFM